MIQINEKMDLIICNAINLFKETEDNRKTEVRRRKSEVGSQKTEYQRRKLNQILNFKLLTSDSGLQAISQSYRMKQPDLLSVKS
jgi:hypothetical protein